MTYAGVSLGPVDIVARYLPDQFGRKSTTLEADNLEIALVVPRSWYLAERDNPWWEVARGMLDEIVPFADPTAVWSDQKPRRARAGPTSRQIPKCSARRALRSA